MQNCAIKAVYDNQDEKITRSKYQQLEFDEFFKTVSDRKSTPQGSHADVYREMYDNFYKTCNEKFEKGIQHCFNMLNARVPFDRIPLDEVVEEVRVNTCKAVQDMMQVDRAVELVKEHAVLVTKKR